MDHSTHSKTANSGSDNKFLALGELAQRFAKKLKAKQLVIQQPGHIGMPVNLDGRQLGNINFVMLAAPLEQDPRWATFLDVQLAGLRVAKHAESSMGVYAKPVEAETEGIGETPEVKARVLRLLHLFNGSQIVAEKDGALGLSMHTPRPLGEDDVESMLRISAGNAGLQINAPAAGQDIAEGYALHVNMNVSNADRLGEVAHAFARWSRSDSHLSRPMDESPSRQLLVEAMATAMICAETGAKFPQSLADKVNARIDDIASLVTGEPTDFARMGREAWQVKEYVAQFVSADENTIEANTTGDENTFRQNTKSIFGR